MSTAAASATAMRYEDQHAWRDIQQFLPAAMRFEDGHGPREERWDWRGHGVHLDRFPRPASRLKVILLHGVGTNGRQMSLLAGGPLWKRGYETVAVDLPGYGLTEVESGSLVLYDHWVELVGDLVDAEVRRDGRPVVLFGLSAGGMLAYHVAARHEGVRGIAGTCFLDQRDPVVRDATSHDMFMSRIAAPIARVAARTPLRCLKLPMRLVSKMRALVNDRDALRAFLADETSAGNSASLAFLASYLAYEPAIEHGAFTRCPILLVQPEKDRWTPIALSERFLERVRGVRKDVIVLGNAGHYPLEQPGLGQLDEALAAFLGSLAS